MMKKWKKILLSLSMTAAVSITGSVRAFADETMKITPQSDFYTFVNEQWLNETKIPEGKASNSNFFQISEKTKMTLMQMLEEMNKDYDSLKDGSDEKKLIDFYRMAVDFKTRNTLGFSPIKKDSQAIRAVKSIKGYNAVSMRLLKDNVKGLISLNPLTDTKDSTMTALYIGGPALVFDKEYMDRKDENSKRIIKKTKQFVADAFMLNGNTKKMAKKKAKLLYKLEKKIASVMASREEQQNLSEFYNVRTWKEIKKLAPKVPYKKAAEALKLGHASKIILLEPKVLEKIDRLYTDQNLEAMKAQLEFKLIGANIKYLSKEGLEAVGRHEAEVFGVTYSPLKDEELAYKLTEEAFGNLLGKVYVTKHFPESAKKDILEMVEEIKTTYKKRIKALDWMTEDTKLNAIKKLDSMTIKVGYPDKWEDYGKIKIRTKENGGTLTGNVKTIEHFIIEKNAGTLNKAPDKTVWELTPQTVNAYYNPLNNEIVFPAGILQKPFYDPEAPKEENLGGIGAVIGHEMTHALDNAGAQFDENGNLRNWWNPDDFKRFDAKVKQAADIFSKLEVAPGYFVNGTISTGEIIADLGGITLATDIAKEKGYDTKKLYKAYARVWRELKTEEAKLALLIDEHPPGKYRTNNILNQLDQFYIDFDIKEGDPMYVKPEERLKVW